MAERRPDNYGVPAHTRILRSGHGLRDRMRQELLTFDPENPETHRFVETLPPLVKGENRVRYNHSSGMLYLDSWREQNGEGRQTQQTKHRWSAFPHIERVIRQTGHVSEKYNPRSGIAVQQIQGAAHLAVELIQELQHGELTAGLLRSRYGYLMDEFAALGLLSAIKESKQEIVKKLLGASSNDRLQRFNPLASRSRAASALLGTTRELLIAREVGPKYSNLHKLLFIERTIERLRLEHAVQLLSETAQTIPPGQLGPASHRTLQEAVDTSRVVCQTLLAPDVAKAAPYRNAAVPAHYELFTDMLVDRTEQPYYRTMVREVAGPDQFDWQMGVLQPFPAVLAHYKRDPRAVTSDIHGRINAATSLLQRGLEVGDLNRMPWTDTAYTEEERAAKYKEYGGVYDEIDW